MAHKFLFILLISFISFYGFSQHQSGDNMEDLFSHEKTDFMQKSSFVEADNYTLYDLYYQQMKWIVNPEEKFISGEITSYFKSKANNLAQIEFDLRNELTVDSIVSRGKRINFEHTNDKIIIPLSQQLPNNASDSVIIYYHGIPPGDSGFGSFAQSEHGNTPIIWTLSEPFGAKDWWPCKQSLIDKIDSIDIIVSTPNEYLTASNGVLVSNTVEKATRTMHWKHRYPIATYLVAIAVTNYEVYSDTLFFEDDRFLRIENYVYPEDIDLAKSQTSETVRIMKLFNELFGEYPFSDEKYGHAQFGWPGGMEHQTMSFMYNFRFELVAHELAHQWFGDYITLNSWHDIWLNEGFATYLTGLTIEHLKDETEWKNWKKNTINKIIRYPDGSVYVDDTTEVSRIFNNRLSYSKGAYLLHMLRWVLGEENFYNGIRNYFNDPEIAGGFASNEQLIMHLEEAGDTSLTEFFKDWYYGEGFPVYSVDFGKTEGNKTWINLLQTPSHNSVDFFEMPVPVRLFNANRTDSIDFRLENTHNNQRFLLDVDFKVESIELDPDLWLISKTELITNISENHSSDFVKIYPNPFTDHINIFASNNIEIEEITLLTINGRSIKTFPEHLSDIDLSSQPPGIYVMKVITNRGEFSQKIVKR